MSQPPPLPPGSIPAPDEPPVIQYATPMQYAEATVVWRDGIRLVVPRNGPLPMRCVKCNAEASARYMWRKTLSWHNPALYVLILFPGVLIYAIVALIVRKTSKVQAGLCEMHGRRRRKRVLIGWLIALAGIGAFALAIFLGNQQGHHANAIASLVIAGFALILVSLFWAVLTVRVLWPSKIDARYAWLNGACVDYLETLPSVGQAPAIGGPGTI